MNEQPKDIHYIGRTYSGVLKQLECGHKTTKKGNQELDISSRNRETLLRFLIDGEIGKTIKKGQKKKIGKGRLLRLSGIIKNLDRWFDHKPFEEVTQAEMEKFILGLERGEIKQKNGKPYTPESQMTIKRAIRKFYKWLLGECERHPNIVAWIDTSGKLKEIEPPKFKEIENKLKDATIDLTTEERAIIALLTDPGLRIGELLNLNISDVSPPDDQSPNWRVRVSVSKTTPRTIAIYFMWEHVKNYYESLQRKGKKGFFVDRSYQNVCDILRNVGKKFSMEKKLHAHLLRHTSATYYSNYLTHSQLCQRYGWSLTTKVIQRYVSLNGIETPDTIRKLQEKHLELEQQKNSELQKSNSELMLQMQQMSEQFKQMQDRMRMLELQYIEKATEQQKPIVVQTPRGQEIYSCSGANVNGIFKPVEKIKMMRF